MTCFSLRLLRRAALACTLAACASMPPGLYAQPAFRDISGTVTDRHHEPLRGAVVQVHNDASKSVISYITDTTGQYRFKRLDSNTDYEVWATWRGTRSHVKKLSIFDPDSPKVVNLIVINR